MTTERQPSLFDGRSDEPVPVAAPGAEAPDADARRAAADPRRNVVLEASAGTGKTSVLVARYLALLRAGVDPRNMLAITFTRKAAAEMRQRIVDELRGAAVHSDEARRCWLSLRDRLGELSISTIDAFCFSLLREFPLEADVDPDVEMADETEVARLGDEAIDRALSIGAGIASRFPEVALLFTELTTSRLRAALAFLLAHRLEAPAALERSVRAGEPVASGRALSEALHRLVEVLGSTEGGMEGFLRSGPVRHPRYRLFEADLRRVTASETPNEAEMRVVLEEARRYFLTRAGAPRQRITGFRSVDWRDAASRRRHMTAVQDVASSVQALLTRLDERVGRVLVGGLSRLCAIAVSHYRRRLAEKGLVDFPEALVRAVGLLERMDEFSQSRFRLESRYHHLLIDEFQDTSGQQWRLISLLIDAWGEGAGLVAEGPLPPSIFLVGDRKQSIYGFRDADPAILGVASGRVAAIRQQQTVRHAIATSFRSVPALLEFANDLFEAMPKDLRDEEGFSFGTSDRFPVSGHGGTLDPACQADGTTAPGRGGDVDGADPVLGLAVGADAAEAATKVASEIVRLLGSAVVRDKVTGVRRAARPADIAVLFRSRDSHREFESAIMAAGVPTYVYKGLGFFDTDEIKDLSALVRFLARPTSDLRAAAFLRSRFIRLSDETVRRLAPDLAQALTGATAPPPEAVEPEDREVLAAARDLVRGWLALVDRLPPAELIDRVLAETAYAFELCGSHRAQGRENVKKFREIVRRIQNAGYASLDRLAAHVDRLSTGDESNATLDAAHAVHLMTIHAAKGLEFPIVFLVNIGRGGNAAARPVRVVHGRRGRDPLVAVGTALASVEEEERWRDREETKRLLYVAITRARDRLYLSSVLKDGAARSARGSLAEVLPPSLLALFETAAAPHEEVLWHGPGQRAHRFRVCHGTAPPTPQHAAAQRSAPDPDTPPSADPSAAPFRRADVSVSASFALDVEVARNPDERRRRSRRVLEKAVADANLRTLLDAGRAALAVPFVARLAHDEARDSDPAHGVPVRGTFDLVIDLPDRVVIGTLTDEGDAPGSADTTRLMDAAAVVFPGRQIESVRL